jgi:tetratricopeptide (TPR) repeat protein
MSKRNQSKSKPVASPESFSEAGDAATAHRIEENEFAPRRALQLGQNFVNFIPVALAFFSSLNTLWLDFATDDTQQILNNVFIKDLKNLPFAFTTSVWSFASNDIGATAQPYYRPMFSVLFTVVHAVVGTSSAFGWHLVNVLIHAAVAWLTFVVCRKFTQNRNLALIAASLFAVHPVHAESVAWISGVTDPLMSLFLLPSFYFYLRYRETEKRQFIFFTLLLFLCALWSKETAVGLPLVIAYCELFHFDDAASWKVRVRRLAVLAVMFVAPVAIYIFARYQAFGAFVASDDVRYPFSAALKTIPLAAIKYLSLMSVPIGYSYQHYTPFVTSFVSLQFLLPVLVLAIVVAAIIFSKSRLLNFASVWFLAFLLPALAGIVSFDPSYLVQERYLYVPSIGFCLAVALGIEWIAGRQFAQAQRIALAMVVLLVIIWGGVCLKNNSYWHDSVTIFQRAVAADPNSAYAHAGLSIVYATAGKPRDAEQESKRALELDPQCIFAYSNLSFYSKQSGKLDEAIAYLEQAKTTVALTPITRTQIATIYLNLGLLYAARKDFDLAEKTLQESNALWSRTIGYYYMGQFYFNQGRYEEALPFYETVLRRLPENYAPIRLSIGAVYERLGKIDQALFYYHKYLALAPDNAPDRDVVFKRIKQIQAAQGIK